MPRDSESSCSKCGTKLTNGNCFKCSRNHANFKELHAKAAKVLNRHHGPLQTPIIERGVEEIDELTRRLVEKTNPVTEQSKAKTDRLLAKTGLDTDEMARNITNLDIRATFEPLEPLADTDVQGYLQHEHKMMLMNVVEETKNNTIKQFSINYANTMHDEWESKKQALLNSYSHRQGSWASSTLALEGGGYGAAQSRDAWQPNLLMGATMLGSSAMVASQTGRRGNSSMDPKMMEYSRAVYELNEHRLAGNHYPLVAKFHDVSAKMEMESRMDRQDVQDCWKLLAAMLDETAVGRQEGHYTNEGLYSRPPWRDNEGKYSYDLRRQFNTGARHFLQEQYRRWMGEQVGNKGLLEDVRAYVRMLPDGGVIANGRKDSEGGPLWATLFYLVRCGGFDVALKYAERNRGLLQGIFLCLSMYCETRGGLPEESARNELQRRSRPDDPYELALYILLGRVEVVKMPADLFQTVQDFMWLKLHLVIEPEEDHQATSNIYLLENLQESITSCGPSHFVAEDGENALVYFQILAMSQQFELAIEYLAGMTRYHVEAAHVAIALYYYGVVGATEEAAADVAQVIGRYVWGFLHTDAREALEYLCLLDGDLRAAAICNLVLETGEYKVLLGAMQPDGSIMDGCIAKFRHQGVDVRSRKGAMSGEDIADITNAAADACADTGRVDDAIQLYILARNTKAVIALLNRELSQCLTVPSQQREQKKTAAEAVYRQLLEDGAANSPQAETFDKLRSLMDFFDLVHQRRYEDARELIHHLHLVPSTDKDLDTYVESFFSLDRTVRGNFADVLLGVMTVYFGIYEKAKRMDSDPQALRDLKEEAHVLIHFSQLIQLRGFSIPADTNSRLLNWEVHMN